jgi:cold shock CspA family protein
MTVIDEVKQDNPVRSGEVVYYNLPRSFGFIREIGKHGTEQFFHIDYVVGRTVLQLGDLVTFTVELSPNKPGKTRAANVRLQKRDAVPSASLTGVSR